jgi:hypothetical protein
MKNEEGIELTIPRPGRYGRSLMLPKAISINETPEEQTWPMVDYSFPKDYRPVLITDDMPQNDENPVPTS